MSVHPCQFRLFRVGWWWCVALFQKSFKVVSDVVVVKFVLRLCTNFVFIHLFEEGTIFGEYATWVVLHSDEGTIGCQMEHARPVNFTRQAASIYIYMYTIVWLQLYTRRRSLHSTSLYVLDVRFNLLTGRPGMC